jgi:hypothetical protein
LTGLVDFFGSTDQQDLVPVPQLKVWRRPLDLLALADDGDDRGAGLLADRQFGDRSVDRLPFPGDADELGVEGRGQKLEGPAGPGFVGQ